MVGESSDCFVACIPSRVFELKTSSYLSIALLGIPQHHHGSSPRAAAEVFCMHGSSTVVLRLLQLAYATEFLKSSRAMRQRSITEFCFRYNGSQPSTARHGTAESLREEPTQQLATQLESDSTSPLSIASSASVNAYNPNVGLQLCTSICVFTELSWPTLLPEERTALQSSCYFINSDLRWYIRDLSAVTAPRRMAPEAAESETPTDNEIPHSDSEAGVVYSALPRTAGGGQRLLSPLLETRVCPAQDSYILNLALLGLARDALLCRYDLDLAVSSALHCTSIIYRAACLSGSLGPRTLPRLASLCPRSIACT